jgi:hypothetical protein
VSHCDECATDSLSVFSVLNGAVLQLIGNSFETAYCTLLCDNDVEKGLGKCNSLLL